MKFCLSTDLLMETTSKQLVLKNISKHFGELVAVKDVDLVIEPIRRRSGRRNGNTPFLFLHHVVHSSGTIMNLTHAMDDAGVVQNTFRGSGLTRIDMSNGTDIADSI